MDYQQPMGTSSGTAYVTGNPATNTPGSIPTGPAIEYPQREIVNLITAAGITPSNNDLTQLAKAIQSGALISANNTGNSDALVGVFPPAIGVLYNGMLLCVRANAVNVTTTPTFTPNAGLIPSLPIVKVNNLPLAVGDIAGAGHWLHLQYDAALNKWVLTNPPVSTGTPLVTSKIQSITALAASNALTCTLNPTTLDFRSSTLGSGAVSTLQITVALSLVVPSGATLGSLNGTQSQLLLVALNNAGTVSLGVVNVAGGNNLDESNLISTTAISAAATANNVVYAASALTNVPFRVVGYILSTQVTAGVWATAPSTVQGDGGMALASLQGLGNGQGWINYVASASGSGRALATTYYNTTGKPIQVNIQTGVTSGNTTLTVNGVQACFGVGVWCAVSAIVPPGSNYQVTNNSGANLYSWSELR